MDVLLIELPFGDITRPNLGLSLLKASVEREGFSCSILYASIKFASLIGRRVYSILDSGLPQHLLLGDRIFCLRDFGYINPTPRLEEAGIPLGLHNNFEWLQHNATLFLDDTLDDIAALNPKLVGFSMLFQTVPSITVAKALKARMPNVLTIAGGANCEGEMGYQILKHYPQFDYVCRGPGERLLPSLLAVLRSSDANTPKSLYHIKGLVWREGSKLQTNGPSGEETNLNDQLLPDFSDWIFQLEKTFPDTSKRSLWLPIESSRGCWWGQKHHCVFCGLNGETMAFRQKTPGKFIADLEDYRKYNIPNIYTTDLIFPHSYYETFLPKFAKHPLSRYFNIFYEIKSNIRKSQMRLLADASVRWLQPGVEALDTELLNLIGKGVSGWQHIQLLKWAAELGVTLNWNLLYGLGLDHVYERTAKIIPYITHLAPPSSGCFEIRVDRFSPMHESWRNFSHSPPVPVPAYRIIHPTVGEDITSLAYHFQYAEQVTQPAVNDLRRAVRLWESSVGVSSFFHWEDENGDVHLYDTRQVARIPEAILTADSAVIYRHLDEGCGLEQLANNLGKDTQYIYDEVTNFQENGWIIHIDGRVIALSCDYSEIAKPLPKEIRSAALHVLHTKKMQQMWKQGRERRESIEWFNNCRFS